MSTLKWTSVYQNKPLNGERYLQQIFPAKDKQTCISVVKWTQGFKGISWKMQSKWVRHEKASPH